MGMQLSDLVDSFSEMNPEEQLKKIEKIRDTRTIERPAVARRRRKKEASRSQAAKTKLKKLLEKMSSEEREAFLNALGGDNEET